MTIRLAVDIGHVTFPLKIVGYVIVRPESARSFPAARLPNLQMG